MSAAVHAEPRPATAPTGIPGCYTCQGFANMLLLSEHDPGQTRRTRRCLAQHLADDHPENEHAG